MPGDAFDVGLEFGLHYPLGAKSNCLGEHAGINDSLPDTAQLKAGPLKGRSHGSLEYEAAPVVQVQSFVLDNILGLLQAISPHCRDDNLFGTDGIRHAVLARSTVRL